MTELLYLKDHYLREFEAEVVKVENNFIVLNKTCFYPVSGGQLGDHGTIKKGEETFHVIHVKKSNNDIYHHVDKVGLKKGDKIVGIIDWERRYKLMRAHTAAHILSQVIHKETSTLITGNQLDLDKIRIDFSLESLDREKILNYIEKTNEIINEDLQVTTEFKTREEALKIPQISKLAMGLPQGIKEVRIVKIGDFDLQADAGTHVNSTKEIGKIEFIKTENKGKDKKRIYCRIKD